MTDVIDKLNWRYATKKFDPTKQVSAEKLEHILEAIRLAPTSSGLQPFEVFVVTNPDIRAKIQAVGWNQGQISESSHLLVFAAWDDITADRVNMMFDLTNEQRGSINEGWEAYRKQLLGIVAARGQQGNFDSAARQAYIALGVAMVAAAFEGVDATPMEGFDPAAVDEILSLKERKLRSVVMLPIGYRQPEGDWLVNLKKVRRSRPNLITEVA
ncbi:NAD(P)H-dependent oxidoreductase [Duganella violaceipulchra]|uniref:NAD(P)H-dependent oxidoreductase n=1 Tax=Duganella violaceipulchra TaxID=2849652 RepID=A0AA41L142_9BURK|nr:NAD(P)H-dependent oxidoreductase [Duganella violaceicalia]MBV6324161.1 NAD(P)H-dependent oxidoreductase [Duganella violaceicalia]MCP2011906.1 nitroreductase [Duganella violaceicalia]